MAQIVIEVPDEIAQKYNGQAIEFFKRQAHYEYGKMITKNEMDSIIESLGWSYKFCWNHNMGLPFFLQGNKVATNSIEDLYKILLNNGPVYAAYNIPWTIRGHIVLITGVDINRNYVYTNNPWGVTGTQKYSDFLCGFEGGEYIVDSRYQLYGIYIPSF